MEWQGQSDALSWPDIKNVFVLDKKEKMKGLELLTDFLKQNSLERSELGEFIDLTTGLLSDSNFKVAQQTMDVLKEFILKEREAVKPYVNTLIPAVVERLGDSRQTVRQQALHVLVCLFQTLRPEFVWDKLAQHWNHKNWKIKHGLLEVTAEAISVLGNMIVPAKDQSNPVLKQVIKLLEDQDSTVRDAAVNCLVEVFRVMGPTVLESVRTSAVLRPAQQREVLSRLTDLCAVGGSISVGGGDVCEVQDRNIDAVSIADIKAVAGGPYADLTYASGMDARDVRVNMVRAADAAGMVPAVKHRPPSASGAATQPAPTATPATVPVAAAAPTSAPAAAPTAPKRGGYKDSGSVATDGGDLPPAAPITIYSEKELRADLEECMGHLSLAPNLDWQQRMSAMAKVEGLVLGGAADYDAFHEALKGLATTLCQQFKERRSTIARQTCHLVSVLAQALGPRFEPSALTIIPTLLTVVVITVQVMAESADSGIRSIISHCQTAKVLTLLAEAVSKEKNPKTRCFCAQYLQQILEEWDSAVIVRCADVVDAAIKFAAQDSQADTRQAARAAMAAYQANAPERAAAFLRRVDASLADKLTGTSGGGAKASRPSTATVSRQALKAAFAAGQQRQQQQQAAVDESVVIVVAGSKPAERVSAPPQRPPMRPSSAADLDLQAIGQPVTSSSSSSSLSSMALPGGGGASTGAGQPPRAKTAGASRKSLCLPPGRVLGSSSTDLTPLIAEAGDKMSNMYIGASSAAVSDAAMAKKQAARRVSSASGAAPMPGVGLPQRVPSTSGSAASTSAGRPDSPERAAAAAAAAAAAMPPPAPVERSSSGRQSNAFQQLPVAAARPTTQQLFAALNAGPRTWSDKIDVLAGLSEVMTAMAAGEAELVDVSAPLERSRERVMEALEDPHHKVVSAALELVRVSVQMFPRAYETILDRLMPVLVLRLCDCKEALRPLCIEAIKACGMSYRPEVLLPVLTKSLEQVKVPRGRIAILEFFRDVVAQVSSREQLHPGHLRTWLHRLSPLLEDKSLELRHLATDVVEGLWAAEWPRETLTTVAYQSNSLDVVPLRKLVLALNGAAQAASIAVAGSSASIAPAAAVPMPAHRVSASNAAVPAPMELDGDEQAAVPQVSGVEASAAAPASISGINTREAFPSESVAAAHGGRPASAAAGPSVSMSQQLAMPSHQQYNAANYMSPARHSISGLPSSYGVGSADAGPSSWPAAQPVNVSASVSGVEAWVSSGGAAAPVSRGPMGQAGVPADKNAQVMHIERVLAAARKQGPAPELLARLADAAEACSLAAWKVVFPKLSVEVGAWAASPNPEVREALHSAMRRLMAHQPQLFTDNNLASQLAFFVAACNDPVVQVNKAAAGAVMALVAAVRPESAAMRLRALLLFEHRLHLEQGLTGHRLVAVLEALKSTFKRMSRPSLEVIAFQPAQVDEPGMVLGMAAQQLRAMPPVLHALLGCCDDAHTGVRKAAVLGLAELWYLLGHRVRDEVVAACSHTVRHLVAVYYLKRHNINLPSGTDPMMCPYVCSEAPVPAMPIADA